METELIQKSRLFAEQAFARLPKEYVYHNFDHTVEVVQAAEEIGRATQLTDEELETVMVAAWLHDVGFVKGCSNHELQSALDAEKVLADAGASPAKIRQVKQAIEATRMPQQPRNLVEQVLCDADLYHLSNGNLEEAAQRLQQELSVTQNMHLTQDQWNEHNLAFLKQHEYFTPYGREVLEERKRKNVKKLKKMMKQGADPDFVKNLEKELEKLQAKIDKKANPERGIETMFRIASENHTTLSGMADTKANIMISINSIILSVVVTVLFRKLEEFPDLLIPTLMLVVTCLVTIVFSILATRPHVSSGVFTRQDIEQKKTNLLFFGNFYSMTLTDYEWGMREMMKNADYLYSSLMKDIYFNGTVLARKYKMLRWAYSIFMFGFVSSILAFLAAMLIYYYPEGRLPF